MFCYDYGEWDMVAHGRPRQCPECDAMTLTTDGEFDEEHTHIEFMYCYECRQYFRFCYRFMDENENRETGFYEHLPLYDVSKHDEDQD